MATNAVEISVILLAAITSTAPPKAPVTAAVMPSTKASTCLFLAIFLK